MPTELWPTIANLGFPALVAVILLWRFDGSLKEIKDLLVEATTLLRILCKDYLGDRELTTMTRKK